MNRSLLIACVLSLWHVELVRADAVFQSGPERVSLLELYTSEGCSSCPPAESWLEQLRDDQRLWKKIVPVAFHVGYWDSLGWKDRFAKPGYTERQQLYATLWGGSSVYTPAFVLNGDEWRGWFAGEAVPIKNQQAAGNLRVVLHGARAAVTFEPVSANGLFEVHFAPLAMQVESEVRAGENRGRRLEHQFVALGIVSQKLDPAAGIQHANLELLLADAQALAVWVTYQGAVAPVQATGGFIR